MTSTPCPRPGIALTPELAMTEAVGGVIVHHPRRLHVGVADGRTHEGEAALLEIAAHRVRLGTGGGDTAMRRPPVVARAAVHESPHVRVERPELALDLEERAGVPDRALDLQPIADDPGTGEERPRPASVEARHPD